MGMVYTTSLPQGMIGENGFRQHLGFEGREGRLQTETPQKVAPVFKDR
jgi:hypothetical protein